MGDWQSYLQAVSLAFEQITRGEKGMHKLKSLVRKLTNNTMGQDLIEYALMAGFVAVSAGAIMPGVATSISQIFSQVASVLTAANGS
jgi:Flp pilus assembly pilin Flp